MDQACRRTWRAQILDACLAVLKWSPARKRVEWQRLFVEEAA
ncbi:MULTISPECIES: hypothetical protein [Candidatus Accumulibacter]|uniref:Uncharacterized protein n=1 Tax=Candidatus Accumulibacter phosphatis TaxID=327160 RepID=A0A5S4ER28_9PROT|nr:MULTISPECIES: hypothetical protein [Candidatus Accumulibacter]TMQ77927.1 hypothetical protein ACCUM_2527 [Candidatus Accumulibacter phosphatis]HMW56133.1 hypothetical protein [Accumulibacter sp.]HNC19897.1 hypothetical protein [Accumulibacter sp.]HNO13144.1 hypothetical protein [Accumulibacter sp.]HNO73597.1 hypothetical protein [Accumulibacter sp.]